ncbi:MAG TPA: transposase [Thermomicrobiales bacterium]|nr:transposase [Thermomicrobiales bacterium]
MRRFNPRKRQRMLGYDYSLSNSYFVTFTSEHRTSRFGDIHDGRVHLNEPGQMVDAVWRSAPSHHPSLQLDTFVVMPDRIHPLIHLSEEFEERPTVSSLVQWFKTLTTRRYITGVKEHGWAPFDGRLWKMGFHDRIVRDGEELDHIRAYIEDNPRRRWLTMSEDRVFPEVQ